MTQRDSSHAWGARSPRGIEATSPLAAASQPRTFHSMCGRSRPCKSSGPSLRLEGSPKEGVRSQVASDEGPDVGGKSVKISQLLRKRARLSHPRPHQPLDLHRMRRSTTALASQDGATRRPFDPRAQAPRGLIQPTPRFPSLPRPRNTLAPPHPTSRPPPHHTRTATRRHVPPRARARAAAARVLLTCSPKGGHLPLLRHAAAPLAFPAAPRAARATVTHSSNISLGEARMAAAGVPPRGA